MTTHTLTPQATPGVTYRRTVGCDGIARRFTTRPGARLGEQCIRGNIAPPKPEEIFVDDFGELVTLLPLTRGHRAVISLTDFVELQRTHGSVWNATKRRGYCYAMASTSRKGAGKRQSVTAGRVILGAGPGEAVGYVDGDPLNLRRSNLRHEYRGGGASIAKRETRLTIRTPAVLVPRVAELEATS